MKKSQAERERDVENYLKREVRFLGGEVRKVKWLDRRGAPDRLVMLPAKVTANKACPIPAERFLVEVKAPGEKAKPHQIREHDRLRRYGWRVEVVDSPERVDEILR